MPFVRLSLSLLPAAAASLVALALLGPFKPVSPEFKGVEVSILPAPEAAVIAPEPGPPAPAAAPVFDARAEVPVLIPPPRPRQARAMGPKPRPQLMLAAVSTRSYDVPRPLPRPEAAAALDPAEQARLAPLIAEAAALVEAPPTSLRTASPLACLAVSIFHEARDQPLLGQQAVAAVILRRVEVSRWGDTICAVVRPVQFSYLAADYSFPPIREREAWRRALTVAIGALLDGPTPLVSGADHYHATYVSPAWRAKMREVVRIGGHVFYRDPLSAEGPAASRRLNGASALRAAVDR